MADGQPIQHVILPRSARLKKLLGRHSYAERPAQLTLQEMGALVIAAGSEAGFIVQVEVPVPGILGDAKLDCATDCPGNIA